MFNEKGFLAGVVFVLSALFSFVTLRATAQAVALLLDLSDRVNPKR